MSLFVIHQFLWVTRPRVLLTSIKSTLCSTTQIISKIHIIYLFTINIYIYIVPFTWTHFPRYFETPGTVLSFTSKYLESQSIPENGYSTIYVYCTVPVFMCLLDTTSLLS